jgi:hypothetical protein
MTIFRSKISKTWLICGVIMSLSGCSRKSNSKDIQAQDLERLRAENAELLNQLDSEKTKNAGSASSAEMARSGESEAPLKSELADIAKADANRLEYDARREAAQFQRNAEEAAQRMKDAQDRAEAAEREARAAAAFR